MGFPREAKALATGAGSGLGRAIACALAQRGAHVVGTDIRSSELDETGRLVQSAGGSWRGELADAGSWDDWTRIHRGVLEREGAIDILVNNAGVAAVGPVGTIPMEDWRWLVDINLWGVIYGCHLFVPEMKARGSGWILNVASAAGIASAPEMGPYNVAKAGVISLTETLYGECTSLGVRTTVLCPTFFRSSLGDRTRTEDDRLRSLTRKLIDRSDWSAEKVADLALEGLEAGRLYVLPQRDARIMMAARRVLGTSFQRWLAAYRERIERRIQRQLR